MGARPDVVHARRADTTTNRTPPTSTRAAGRESQRSRAPENRSPPAPNALGPIHRLKGTETTARRLLRHGEPKRAQLLTRLLRWARHANDRGVLRRGLLLREAEQKSTGADRGAS